MDRFRVVFLAIILLIVLFGPDGSSSGKSRHADEIIAHEKQQLDVLRNSTFGHPANLTGVFNDGPTPPESVRDRWRATREKILGSYARDAASAEAPSELHESSDTVRTKLSTQRPLPELPIYRNATGNLHGRWAKLEFPGLQRTEISNATYERNVTVSAGKMSLSIEETANAEAAQDVREMGAVVRFKDEDGGNEVAIALHGVHFVRSGEMVLTTTSERFAGIFALPHFTSTEAAFSQSKELLLEATAKAIEAQQDTETTEASWLSLADGALAPTSPKCEYIAYIQLHPIAPSSSSKDVVTQKTLLQGAGVTPKILLNIERELRFPTGALLPSPPPIVTSIMVYSPTCGFVAEAEELSGQKLEQFFRQASNFGLTTAVITAIQIWLLIRQMNETNTPSTVSRISFWTVAMMSVVDGYFLFSFMIVALFVHACFLPLITASFCFLILLTMFEMRFLVTTYRVQRPERHAAASQAHTPPTATPPSGEGGLPLPVTATAPQTPAVIPPATQENGTADADDDIRSEIGTLHTRFYFALLATLFLTVHASSWPPFFRNLFLHAILLLANSYWVPQLYRNVQRGCRKAFRWEFVFGTSLCRVLGAMYLYLYPNNLFHLEVNTRAAAVVAGWVWIQCAALLSQEMFGPRFLIPTGWLPAVYDYHSAMPLEAGDVEACGEESGPKRRSFDCAICMQSVEVPVREDSDGAGGSGGAGRGVGLLGRRGYMVTPCRHVFHSNCLEGWMRFRLQCPICRNALPPL